MSTSADPVTLSAVEGRQGNLFLALRALAEALITMSENSLRKK